MATILIIGCGWLGRSLASSLKLNGCSVLCTTRSIERCVELSQDGLDVFQYSLGEKFQSKQLANIGTVVIAVPPSKDSDYLQNLSETTEYLREKRIILASSTSAYPSSGEFSEDCSIKTPSNPTVFKAEQIVKRVAKHLLVIRFGGLYNTTTRHPGNWMKNKSEISDGWVNMITEEDAVGVIEYFISSKPNETGLYNAVEPGKIKKSEFYTLACRHLGIPTPRFKVINESKWISSEKLRKVGYTFKYSHPTEVFK
ncbi:NAD(P)-binding domain-containing protein [Luteibaculum oceani]|uniref:6-phosphogluconate dehydrogenase NADP-binding domain-containing protein n=1 Tax=Luteibaculum oceani TaxID=1294296 RepID=A0A5C6VPS4_9FLAO|nr:NAD(P)-binding domain-containing protein [Luteibaculum oceani]TXC85328.1 hypothetical protein FRX97_01505 [Luteibaculum oceani]